MSWLDTYLSGKLKSKLSRTWHVLGLVTHWIPCCNNLRKNKLCIQKASGLGNQHFTNLCCRKICPKFDNGCILIFPGNIFITQSLFVWWTCKSTIWFHLGQKKVWFDYNAMVYPLFWEKCFSKGLCWQDPDNDYLLTTSKTGWKTLVEFWQFPKDHLYAQWRNILSDYGVKGF